MKRSITHLALVSAAALGTLAFEGALNSAQAATTIVTHAAACKPIRFGTPTFDTSLAFDANQAPSWAALSVICLLPEHGRSALFSIAVES